MKEILKAFVKESILSLEDAELKLSNNDLQYVIINQKYFDNKFINDVNISEYLPEFKALKAIKKPVLYWFELSSSIHNKAIRDKYIKEYREPMKRKFTASNYRNTASYKSKYEANSKTLYVGKVEKGFWGRLVTHLGYAQSNKTAGMQLKHWYNIAHYGELKLNYIVFDPNMKHLIIILEKQLAKALKPLIGIY